jgi:hypothetical protein
MLRSKSCNSLYPKGLVFVCLLLMLTRTTAALALVLETQTWNFEMQKVMFRASYLRWKLAL